MQTTEFDYNSVPKGFAHCLNGQCPQGSNCLRRKIALHVPDTCQFIKIVNPAYTPPAGGQCPFYKSGKPLRFARGMTHMYDTLPHNAAVDIKQTLLCYFGRSGYYRLFRKESLFDLQDQAYIRQLFLKHGITSEPAYDDFVEGYAW